MSTSPNPSNSAGSRFLNSANAITRKHLEAVADESAQIFSEMLAGLWLADSPLSPSEARGLATDVKLLIRRHYPVDQAQTLFAFFLDFFSGGLSGNPDGTLSFTKLEFEGLQRFHADLGDRLPESDRTKLKELIDLLNRA